MLSISFSVKNTGQLLTSFIDFNLANLFTPTGWSIPLLGRKVCLNDPWYCKSKISSWKLLSHNFISVYGYICVCELVFTEGHNDFILIISSFNNCLCHLKFSNYELFFYCNCGIISSIRDNIFITEFGF